jgi:hypothetical protein
MRRRPWTSAEIRALLSRYVAEGPRPLAGELRRTEYSVSSFARRLGLRTPRRSYQRCKQGQGDNAATT